MKKNDITNKKFSTFIEFVEEYGLNLDFKYLDFIIKDPKTLDLFYDRLIAMKDKGEINRDYVIKIFSDHFADIDQEAYIFYSMKTLIDTGNLDRVPKNALNCLRSLMNSEYCHYEFGLTEDEKDIEIKRITACSLIGATEIINETKARKRIDRMEKNGGVAAFLDVHSMDEMRNFYCSNPKLVDLIISMSLLRALEKVEHLSPEEKLELLKNENLQEFGKRVNKATLNLRDDRPEDFFVFADTIAEYIIKYPNEFDIDKMLIIAAARATDLLEHTKREMHQTRALTTVLTRCKNEIKSHSAEIIGLADLLGHNNEKPYTYNDLLEANSRITPKGNYLSHIYERLLRGVLFNQEEGENLLLDEDPDIISVMKFSNEEYELLFQKEENLSYLMKNKILPQVVFKNAYEKGLILQIDLRNLLSENLISEKAALGYITKLEQLEPETFILFNEKNMLTNNANLELYLKGKVEFDDIDLLPEDKKQELTKVLTLEKLAELFKNKDREDSKEEYIRFVKLFRSMVLKEKSEEEKDELYLQLIDTLDSDPDLEISNEMLEELYKSHLISFKTLNDWADKNFITEMMNKAEIRPEDVQKMCLGGSFDLLYEALKNPKLTLTEKMMMLHTSFANIDYDNMTAEKVKEVKEAKQKCLRLINLTSKSVKIGDKKLIGAKSLPGTTLKGTNEFVSDPLQRWDLLALMGENSCEALSQGMVIFKYPNYKGGAVILEKMFRRTQPEYGRATKILRMSPEEFDKIKDELIIKGDIPVHIVDSHPKLQGKIDSFNHSSSWGEQIAEYFDYKHDPQRTQEEIDKIDKAIKTVRDSRELRSK